jgi:hypothetical protein
MKAAPQMLQVANDLGTVDGLWHVVVDVQPCTGIHSCSQVLEDLQRRGKAAFDLGPGHGAGFDFQFCPADACIT